ncbi:MAG: branched-chain amino acid ABC transporter permease [Anaerolineaceae bacterium]|nr:branched-chain amino acid ABC transporter permease [Anaerolineaceae bacterium]
MLDTYTRRSEFLAGIRDTLPLEVGGIPFGIIFGALAVNSGLSPAAAMGFSLFVYAGSAQFIGANLVRQSVGILLIVFTTFIINVRHALYSVTLSPHTKHLPQRWLLPLGFWLTDETFVMVINRYNKPDTSPYKHWYHLGSALFMYLNWNLWTLVGIVAGRSIPDLTHYGLDFAMDVTFIGMILPQLKNRPMTLAALVAGVSAVIFNDVPNKLGLIIAVSIGIVVGLITDNLTGETTPIESVTPPITTDEIPS